MSLDKIGLAYGTDKSSASHAYLDIYKPPFSEVLRSTGHNVIKKLAPIQQYFDPTWFVDCLSLASSDLDKEFKVTELGGYDGALAKEVLSRPAIAKNLTTWENWEVIPHAVVDGLDFRYTGALLSAQPWLDKNFLESLSTTEAFVSSHALEHFSDKEVRIFLNFLCDAKPAWLVLEVDCLPTTPKASWNNYRGTHLLTLSATEMRKQLGNTYALVAEEGDWKSFWRLKS